MALLRWHGREWDPLKELMDIQRETERLFDSTFDNLPTRLSREAVWTPSIDVVEDQNALTIKADLPGVKQSDIEVSVSGDILTIRGERSPENDVKDKKVHRIERFYGSFARTMRLPDYLDTEKIKATYRDGTLEVSLPKTERSRPKQIKVDVQ